MSHRPCYAVVFAPGFHHVGAHYVDADEHTTSTTQLSLWIDDRVVWSAPLQHVSELRRFDSRKDAETFHKLYQQDLLEGRGPREGVARPRGGGATSRSAVIENVLIRVHEP